MRDYKMQDNNKERKMESNCVHVYRHKLHVCTYVCMNIKRGERKSDKREKEQNQIFTNVSTKRKHNSGSVLR